MSRLRLSELAAWVDGHLHGPDCEFDGVGSDTRTLNRGELFVALRGPSFDGHDYLGAARARGAAGALVEQANGGLASVAVADSLHALGDLARRWRQRCSTRVIAITGSNGKTTLKEMLAAILAHRGPVLATQGNLNNAIGVPLTLCRLRTEPCAVIELGANHAGEIDYLSDLTRPDIAVLNNAGRAHLEGFGSLEGVARAKAEIINGLAPKGLFVFNADDRFAELWHELGSAYSQRTFGIERAADVTSPKDAYEVVWDGLRFEARFPVRCPEGEIELRLSLAGAHNRMNALAAVAAGVAAGVDLTAAGKALAGLAPVAGRLCPLAGIGGARLIDDSYNANPDSVIAALHVLAAAPGRRTLVLGDLAELGAGAPELHRQLGEFATQQGIERLLTVGPFSARAGLAFGGEHRHFEGRGALADWLSGELTADDSVLVKGSRSARMDEVVELLRDRDARC